MPRTVVFLVTIMIVASLGRAAETNPLKTRGQDYAGNDRQPATAEASGHESLPLPNSTATSTSQEIHTSSQAIVVARASLAADGQTGSSEPNAPNRGNTAGKTSAAPDPSGSQTTSPRDPAVQNVSEEPAATRGQLPQTSTILPLLGLIGLGSLVAGFFARR